MLRIAHELGQQDALNSVGLDPVEWFINQVDAMPSDTPTEEAPLKEKPLMWGAPASIEAGSKSTQDMEVGLPNYGGV